MALVMVMVRGRVVGGHSLASYPAHPRGCMNRLREENKPIYIGIEDRDLVTPT